MLPANPEFSYEESLDRVSRTISKYKGAEEWCTKYEPKLEELFQRHPEARENFYQHCQLFFMAEESLQRLNNSQDPKKGIKRAKAFYERMRKPFAKFSPEDLQAAKFLYEPFEHVQSQKRYGREDAEYELRRAIVSHPGQEFPVYTVPGMKKGKFVLE